MKKSSLYYTAFLFAALISVFYGCKKVNGIDNNTVIETPYSLYFADSSGTLYNSTDGKTYSKVFTPDGYPSRALCTSGNYVLWCKSNIYSSSNNGYNFDQAYDSLQSMPTIAVTGQKINLNQSMIIDIPGSPGFVYATSNSPFVGSPYDFLGVAYNNNHGLRGSWSLDNNYDTTGVGLLPVSMTSFTLLPDGTLAGLAVHNDTPRNFVNSAPLDASTRWEEVTGSFLGSNYTTYDTTLPPNALYPTSYGFFSYGHYNSRLIAIDQKGVCGAWYSDDKGRKWKQYSGLPANTPLLCIASPFDQICLIGTAYNGLYLLNQNTTVWQRNNNGLDNNLVVRGIATKENIYKNNSKVKYVYLATNKGIYQSSDGGINWILTIPGNFVNIY